ncbi:MAG TPA: TPM domain-containing protein [Quisquiliibacterium sp.]|nr:TPM domain-containing protein [Quisquiliibacterium sp.]
MRGLRLVPIHRMCLRLVRDWAVLWMLLCAVCTGAAGQDLQPVPPLAARVTDLTGTLSPDQVRQLDAQLAAIEQRKGAQVAVLMVPTTLPEPVEAYSIRVVEAWKLGRGAVDGKRVDDGVLLLVAKNDRKVRIEVGYGLEGAIPDALARRIIAEAVSPKFRQGDFFGGLQAAVADLGRLIEGEALPQPWQPAEGGAPHPWSVEDLLPVMMATFFVGLLLTAFFGRVVGSLTAGAGGGAFAAVGGAPLLVAVGFGLAAFFVLLVFAATGSGALRNSGRRGPGRGSVWTGGGGGFGGGWGGGSSSGGGFSGGGGGFGGGGASGDW